MASGARKGSDVIAEWFSHSPFAQTLGYRIEELGDGRAVVVLPFSEHLTTLEDLVHGGALAALVDATSSAAAWSGAQVSENARGTTVTLSVDFIRPGRGTQLRAEGHIVRRGRSLC